MKALGRGILAGIFLILTGLMLAAAKWAPEPLSLVYPEFSRWVLAKIAAVTGIFPFVLWEVLALLGILWAVYTLIRSFGRPLGFVRWLAGLGLAASIAAFLFVGLWGLNHYCPTVDVYLDLQPQPTSAAQLEQATQFYADRAGELSRQMQRDAAGVVMLPEFAALAPQASQGYDRLAEQYACFTGKLAPPKALLSGRLFSYLGTTGIFLPFTAESCVNPDAFVGSIPFVMCHELAHRQAVAAEDEANFCAFLACAENDSPEFQYSGYYSAFVYCYNALNKADGEAADRVWASLTEELKTDCRAATAHYKQYEGKVQDAAQKVNDTYLKAFSQEAGVQSYGQAADLLIAWYFKNFA